MHRPAREHFNTALVRRPVSADAALLGGGLGFAAVIYLSVPGFWPVPFAPGIWTTALSCAITALVAIGADRAGVGRERALD